MKSESQKMLGVTLLQLPNFFRLSWAFFGGSIDCFTMVFMSELYGFFFWLTAVGITWLLRLNCSDSIFPEAANVVSNVHGTKLCSWSGTGRFVDILWDSFSECGNTFKCSIIRILEHPFNVTFLGSIRKPSKGGFQESAVGVSAIDWIVLTKIFLSTFSETNIWPWSKFKKKIISENV